MNLDPRDETITKSHASTKNKILTICIPTRDRCELLRKCLALLAPIATMHADDIVVQIIDNASKDETDETITLWKRENNRLEVVHVRKSSNTGFLDSVFMGLESSKTSFFMFVGDDDELDEEGFKKLLGALKGNKHLGMLIEADTPDTLVNVNLDDPQTILNRRARFESKSAFYKFGNAWAGIYNVDAMKSVLCQPVKRKVLLTSLWGQSELAFRAVAENNLRIGTLMFNYGRPHAPNPFNPGGLTSILSASHLLESSLRLAAAHPHYKHIDYQLVDSITSPVAQHLIAIVRRWPKSPSDEYLTALKNLRNLVMTNFKCQRAFWPMTLLLLSNFPSTLRFINSILDLRLDKYLRRSDNNINYFS